MVKRITGFTLIASLIGIVRCYPFMYNQPTPITNRHRGWPGPVVYHSSRPYQPPIPSHYYSQYVSDPYYNAPPMHNPDYYPESYPFAASSYDTGEYYPNYMGGYYFPNPNQQYRTVPYNNYDQTVVEAPNQPQSLIYEVETDDQDGIPKSQKEWWLEQNVPVNENLDFEEKYVAPYNAKQYSKTPKKPLRGMDRLHYEGLDGFGRKKEREPVYGVVKQQGGKWRDREERPKVFGAPTKPRFLEDDDVKQLESLRKVEKPTPSSAEVKTTKKPMHSNGYDLSGWASGEVKRSVPREVNPRDYPWDDYEYYIGDDDVEYGPEEWTDEESMRYFPRYGRVKTMDDGKRKESVFDKITKLLAIEDGLDKQYNEKHAKKRSIVMTDDDLTGQLKALRKDKN